MGEYGDTLPGLTPPAPPSGPITAAAEATITALDAAGLLEPRHRLTCEMVRQLATAVDRGLHAPRVSVATATLSKHLLEAIATLPAPAEGAGDSWEQFQAELARAAAA